VESEAGRPLLLRPVPLLLVLELSLGTGVSSFPGWILARASVTGGGDPERKEAERDQLA